MTPGPPEGSPDDVLDRLMRRCRRVAMKMKTLVEKRQVSDSFTRRNRTARLSRNLPSAIPRAENKPSATR